MEFKDYYQSLGIPKSETTDGIKKAYRKLARTHHPDVNPGDLSAEARFKEINEAYEVLGDPEKRSKYDELGTNWKHYEQGRASDQSPFGSEWPFGSGNVRWSVNVDGAPSRGFRPMSREDGRNISEDDPFSDFFKTFFGRGSRNAQPSPSRHSHDVDRFIELSLEQAASGVRKRLSLQTGSRVRTVQVQIPPGVTDGSRVRVTGKGERYLSGAGDLYLRVRLKPHAKFELKGRDVHVKIAVRLTTAILGGEVDVPTLSKTTLRLKVPPATQPGQIFRLKEQGIPALGRSGVGGDLYATLQVKLPSRLSAEARAHYEALAALENKPKQTAKHSGK